MKKDFILSFIMSVLTKSGQNQACKTQFQSVVCSDGGPPGSGLGPSVALWNNLWRSIGSFFSPFCDFHLAATHFFFFGSEGILCYGERLYLHKLMEI